MCDEFRSGKDSDEGRPLQPFVVGHAAAYLDRYVATQVRLPVTPLHRRLNRRSHRRRRHRRSHRRLRSRLTLSSRHHRC